MANLSVQPISAIQLLNPDRSLAVQTPLASASKMPSSIQMQNSSLKTPDGVQTGTVKGQIPAQDPHFFFISDNHFRPQPLHRFAQHIANERPDLIIDGGDFTHDGTEAEIKRAYEVRANFAAPVKMVMGNHDAHLRGPFKEAPPVIPAFQSFDAKGVHFILLDNEDESLSEEQFQQLEADLKANKGKTTLVAMHVPVKLSKEPFTVTLGKMLPLNFASPVMTDTSQIERFHTLMDKFDVQAVLAGHTHFPDEVVEDGVRYITAGSSGGLTPKPGIPKEYLDIHVHEGQIQVERVQLEAGKGAFAFAGEAFDFYRDLNTFNHEKTGWKDFYPSANLGYQAGFRRVSTEKGESYAATVGVQAERLMGDKGKGSAFASLGVSAGTGDHWDVGVQTSVGYKRSLTGDYNHGAYISGAATANAGYLHGSASAGVGIKAAVGFQHKNWTAEFGQEFSSNYQAQNITVGFRF